MADRDAGQSSAYAAAPANAAAQEAYIAGPGLALTDSSLAATAVPNLLPGPSPCAQSREPSSHAAAAEGSLQTSGDASASFSPGGSPAACAPSAQSAPAAGHSSGNAGAHKGSIGRDNVIVAAGRQQQQPGVPQGSPPELQHGGVAACQPVQVSAAMASLSGGLTQASPATCQANAGGQPQLEARSLPLPQVSAGRQESSQPCSTAQDGATSSFGGDCKARSTEADKATVDLSSAQEDTAAWAAAPVADQAPDSLLSTQLPASPGASTVAAGGLAARTVAAGAESAMAGLAAPPGARQAASPVAALPFGPEESLRNAAATPTTFTAAATGAMQPSASHAAGAGRSAMTSGLNSRSQGAQPLHSQATPQAVSDSYGLR